MHFNIFLSLMLVGALQGLIFARIIFSTPKYRHRISYLLGLLILCISTNALQYFFVHTKMISWDLFFGIFYIPFPTLTVVVYYFYVKLLLNPNHVFSFKEKILFIPFLFFFSAVLFYKLCWASGNLTPGINAFFGKLIYIHEVIGCLYSFILLFLILKLIFVFKQPNSSHKTQFFKLNELKWLKITTIINFVLCIFWGISIYKQFFQSTKESEEYFFIFWTLSAFSVYWYGHIGLQKFGEREERKQIRTVNMKKDSEVFLFESKNPKTEKFEKTILTEKLFLDSELTLDLMAERLHISKSHLSRLINTELGMSFTDYINSLRVKEAQNYIENSEFQNYTLAAIGLEAGFNSKSAFYTAFKKYTGCTPADYRNKIKEEDWQDL